MGRTQKTPRLRRPAKGPAPEILTDRDDESRSADELRSLRDGLLYWFYDRADRKRSHLFADLLESLLRETQEESIFSEECHSLIAEVRGNLPKAIRHREKEIALIRRLHELALGQPGEKYIMRLHGFDDLSYRMDMLAILYHDAGKTARAISLLEESRTLCESHGIPFDGADAYEEYQREPNTARPKRRARTA